MDIYVTGIGAVSPAGWGMQALRAALGKGEPLPCVELPRPGAKPLKVRRVPPPQPRPAFLTDARLRRASAISHYSVSAALEALGISSPAQVQTTSRIGVVFCVMTGCVNYSRRFYDEVLKDPATASPLIFPETVLNAPASHLAALLRTQQISYTMVGDPGTFLQGLAVGAEWISQGKVDRAVVVAAEEMDWLVANGVTLFHRDAVVSEGAGALCLQSVGSHGSEVGVKLSRITSPVLFANGITREEAARCARRELGPASPTALLCDSLQGLPAMDRDEAAAWGDYMGQRQSVKKILGEGLAAASAWQCVAAVDAIRNRLVERADVSVVGLNEQAIAAQFTCA